MAAGKIRKKIKKELIGTSDYPSNKIFTISNFITFTRLILTGVFPLMLLGLPVLDGLGIVPDSLTWLPGLNCTPVPLGIFFVYAGVCCSLLTGLVYTVKGLQAIRNAIAHPEDEDEDFLNPDIDEGEEASAAETA